MNNNSYQIYLWNYIILIFWFFYSFSIWGLGYGL